MKKKVALLLAFVMVLSILPMHVFGRGHVNTVARPLATLQNPQQFTISLNPTDIAGVMHPVAGEGDLYLVVDVADGADTGGATGAARFRQMSPVAGDAAANIVGRNLGAPFAIETVAGGIAFDPIPGAAVFAGTLPSRANDTRAIARIARTGVAAPGAPGPGTNAPEPTGATAGQNAPVPPSVTNNMPTTGVADHAVQADVASVADVDGVWVWTAAAGPFEGPTAPATADYDDAGAVWVWFGNYTPAGTVNVEADPDYSVEPVAAPREAKTSPIAGVNGSWVWDAVNDTWDWDPDTIPAANAPVPVGAVPPGTPDDTAALAVAVGSYGYWFWAYEGDGPVYPGPTPPAGVAYDYAAGDWVWHGAYTAAHLAPTPTVNVPTEEPRAADPLIVTGDDGEWRWVEVDTDVYAWEWFGDMIPVAQPGSNATVPPSAPNNYPGQRPTAAGPFAVADVDGEWIWTAGSGYIEGGDRPTYAAYDAVSASWRWFGDYTPGTGAAAPAAPTSPAETARVAGTNGFWYWAVGSGPILGDTAPDVADYDDATANWRWHGAYTPGTAAGGSGGATVLGYTASLQELTLFLDRVGYGATVRVWLMSSLGGIESEIAVLAEGPLVLGAPAPGVDISASAIAPMTNAVMLAPIRIEESSVGRIAGGQEFAIRLTAPIGFVWETRALPGVSGNDVILSRGNNARLIGISNYNAERANVVEKYINPLTNRHELVIVTTPTINSAGVGSITRAAFTIENLVLIATSAAPAAGDVNIDVEIGHWATRTVVTRSNTNAVWNANVVASQAALDAAVTGGTAATFRVTDEYPTFTRSGTAVANIPDNADGNDTVRNFWNRALTNFAGGAWEYIGLTVAQRGVAAGYVEVIGPATVFEAMSGRRTAFPGGTAPSWLNRNDFTIRLRETLPGSMVGIETYEFRLVQDGVVFVDAGLRFGNAAANQVGSWMGLDNADFVIPGLTNISADGTVFYLTPRAELAAGQRRHRDVRFELDIEGGFEGNFGGEVEVDVFRDGVNIGRVTIAYVEDPIVVASAGIGIVQTNQASMILPVMAPSVTIREQSPGDVGISRLYLRIIPVLQGRNVEIAQFPIGFDIGSITVNSTESGMIIRSLGERTVGGVDVYAIEIIRASANVPAVITLSDIFVTSGMLVPGAELRLVVDGPAVLTNSVLVVGEYGFPGMPYSATILSETGTVAVGGIPVVPAFTWGPFTPNVAGRPAFRLINGAGMTSGRSFAYQIQGTTRWIEALDVAEFVGIHQVTGDLLTVRIPLSGPGLGTIQIINTTRATDDTFDMGVFVGRAPGTHRPELYHGAAMVPIRVMAMAFGFSVSWDAVSQTATFSPPAR